MTEKLRQLFLQQLHQTGRNASSIRLGIRKTQMHVQQRAYWPGWKRDVDRFADSVRYVSPGSMGQHHARIGRGRTTQMD